MANDRRTPTDIEREIERDRADLARTINELQARFTPETMIAEAVRTAREHGGDFGHAVTQSAKQNPLGLAITGIGLAWMMFGRSYEDRAVTSRSGTADFTSRRPVTPPADKPIYPDWYFDEEAVADEYGYPVGSRPTAPGGRGPSGGSRMTEKGKQGASSVADGLSAGAGKVAAGVDAAGSSIADGMASVRDGAASAADAVTDSARRMGDRLASGTEHLSESARDRVLAARHRAVMARERISNSASRNWQSGRDTAVDMFESNPLIGGVLALAAGAAIAAALPSTRKEDDLFGRYSDDLMDEAERIYREELDRAERVGKAALDETLKIVEEKGEQADEAAAGVADTIRSEVAEAGERIKTAAAEEAKEAPPKRDN